MRRWAEQAAPDERADVIVRLAVGTDPTTAANRLAALGAHVHQQALATVVVTATGSVVLALADEPWVLAVEQPHPLLPR